MGNVVVGGDLGQALCLKDLLGSDKVRKLVPGQHPLAQGFAALRRQLIATRPLSARERQSLGDLKLMSGVVSRYEPYWKRHEERFVGDLLNAAICKALLFEIEVIRFGLEPRVDRIEWPIYLEGKRDIRTYGPDMLVECKLIRSDNLDRILREIKVAKGQPRVGGVPFLVAVGFERSLAPEQVEDIAQRMEAQRKWFESHPEITGVLIFSRAPADLVRRASGPLGLLGLEVHFGAVTEVINWRSRDPLPTGFSFKW